jgi:DNA integrity scanning protein DisA with diadenylate cyclase activity
MGIFEEKPRFPWRLLLIGLLLIAVTGTVAVLLSQPLLDLVHQLLPTVPADSLAMRIVLGVALWLLTLLLAYTAFAAFQPRADPTLSEKYLEREKQRMEKEQRERKARQKKMHERMRAGYASQQEMFDEDDA